MKRYVGADSHAEFYDWYDSLSSREQARVDDLADDMGLPLYDECSDYELSQLHDSIAIRASYDPAEADEEVTPGFLFEKGSKAFFYKSDEKNITDKIARKFINAVCDERRVGDKIREAALYSPDTLKDFKRRIDRADLIEIDNGTVHYYRIAGKNFSLNFPEADFVNDVIVI